MDAVQNQRPVSHRAHSPWKSPATRFPHFPQPRRGAEKWKTKSTFLTFPLTVLLVVSKTQKGGLAADRFAPAPGSFFNEKMLQQIASRVPEQTLSATAGWLSALRSPSLKTTYARIKVQPDTYAG
jgi:hypothetical protein